MSDLSDYIAATVQLCRLAAPDVLFGSPEGPATLMFSKLDHPIRQIEFRLRTGQPLQLKYVEVFAERDGAQLNIAGEAELHVGSMYAGTEQLITDRRLLRSHNGA